MIVTAGGLGTRIPSHVPKQFIELGQQPLLAHTLYQCYQALPFDEILLTLPADYRSYWEELYKAVSPKVPHRIVDGGQERFDSVKAALSTLEAGDGLVGIHDGVRPFASAALIAEAFTVAASQQAAVPLVKVRDSLRIQTNDQWMPLDRSLVRKVQTPQVFDLQDLREAYEQAGDQPLTDDAQIWEKAGHSLTFIDGEAANFKLTSDTDLAYARFVFQYGTT